MLRVLAIAVAFALAVPAVTVAEEHHPEGRPGARPFVQPHGGPPAVRGGAQFGYRGRMINRVHLAPFIYPRGFAYRRWVVGGVLPAVFLGSAYFYADWATLGLAPPEPGFQWVRYGPDLLLVNTATGQVVDTVYGAFD
ncbi:MAG: RcnB family protein [Xanthobacteraceae bacterium]